MKDVLKAEFYYLLKNIRYYVFVSIVLVGNVFILFIENSTIKQGISGLMTLVSFVFIAILLLEFTHKDFVNKTMKNYVGNGVSLRKIYFTKLIVCISAVFVIVLITSIFAEIASGNAENFNFAVFAIKLLINIYQIIVVFFICSLIRSGGFAIVASLAYYIGLPIAFSVIPNFISNEIVMNILDTIKNNITFFIQTEVSNQALNGFDVVSKAPTFSPEVMLHFGICTAVIAAITVLGSYLFTLREVK